MSTSASLKFIRSPFGGHVRVYASDDGGYVWRETAHIHYSADSAFSTTTPYLVSLLADNPRDDRNIGVYTIRAAHAAIRNHVSACAFNFD